MTYDSLQNFQVHWRRNQNDTKHFKRAVLPKEQTAAVLQKIEKKMKEKECAHARVCLCVQEREREYNFREFVTLNSLSQLQIT